MKYLVIFVMILPGLNTTYYYPPYRQTWPQPTYIRQPCHPQPCQPQPCQPQPCSRQPCQPQPCHPQPCQPQPCRQQPCQPQPCRQQPCQPQPCLPVKCPPIPPVQPCPTCAPPPKCPEQPECPSQIKCKICPSITTCPILPCPLPPVNITSKPCTTLVPPTDCTIVENTININLQTRINTCIKSTYMEEIFHITYMKYKIYYIFGSAACSQYNDKNINIITELYSLLYKNLIITLGQNYELENEITLKNNVTKCSSNELVIELKNIKNTLKDLNKKLMISENTWYDLLRKKTSCKVTSNKNNGIDVKREYLVLKYLLMNNIESINNRTIKANIGLTDPQTTDQQTIDQQTTDLEDITGDINEIIDKPIWELSGKLVQEKKESKCEESKNWQKIIEQHLIGLNIQAIKKEIQHFCIESINNNIVNIYAIKKEFNALSEEERIFKFTALSVVYARSLKINQKLNKILSTNKKEIKNSCTTENVYKLQEKIASYKFKNLIVSLIRPYLENKIKEIEEICFNEIIN